MAQRVAWGQRRALGRRYSVDPAYELASEEQAQQLALSPQKDARALQASQFEKSLAFNQEQADLNRASSEKAGITGTVGNLATTAALGYFMKGGGSSTGALTSGGYSPAAVNAAGFATPAQEAAITAATNQGLYNATTGGVNYVSPALTDSSLVAADGAGSIGTATGAAGTGAASGGGASTAGMGAISTVGSYLAPAAAGYAAPGLLNMAHQDSTENLGHNLSFGLLRGERDARTLGGAATGAASGAAVGSAIPVVGTAVGAVIGGIAGAISEACIIVTACTSPDSYEVNLSREYRDRFMDADKIRGYYMIAEKVAPFIKRHPGAKRLVKKWLVDRLVDYGEVALGKKEKAVLRSSWIVSRCFLSFCRAVGGTRKSFMRVTGEVY